MSTTRNEPTVGGLIILAVRFSSLDPALQITWTFFLELYDTIASLSPSKGQDWIG